MVQAVVDRLEGRLHVAEVHDPAGLRPRLALDLQFHPERVAMQTRALVPRRHVGEAVRRLEHEDLKIPWRDCTPQVAGHPERMLGFVK